MSRRIWRCGSGSPQRRPLKTMRVRSRRSSRRSIPRSALTGRPGERRRSRVDYRRSRSGVMITSLDAKSFRQMPRIAKNRPTWIVFTGSLCLPLLILALLPMLALAASASAAGTGLADAALPIAEPVSGPPPESTPPAEPQPGAEAPPPTEPAPEAPAEPQHGAEAPPPTEPAPEAPAEPQPGAEAPPPTEPAPESPPPAEPASEPTHESLGGGAGGEKTEQSGSGLTAAEPPGGGLGSTASEVIPAATSAESGLPAALAPTQLAPVNPASLPKSDSSEPSSAASTARLDGESFGCGLAVLGGPAIGNCAPRWVVGGSVSAAADPVALLARAASLATATADLPTDDGRGGSADRSPPANPAPSQAPSGAAGGAAAGGAGSATSAFLTLMARPLLAAPHMIRRLRLSCERWLTACFVLIPERPG